MNEIIYLPVSLGESIDKLTILDIKLDNIKDDRKNDVKIEYDLLYDRLKNFIDKYNDLYISMKKINLIIWNQMDSLRDKNITNNMYLKIEDTMEQEHQSSWNFYLLSVSILKVLSLDKEHRTVGPKGFLDECLTEYNKLVEHSCITNLKLNDKLCPIDVSVIPIISSSKNDNNNV